MKKLIHSIKAKSADFALRSRQILSSQCGEGFIDTAVKILISVVIGALLLAGLYALFGETIMPLLKSRITEMFNYGG
ncbi:MAG: DUF6133 family protein [Hungatella sp.]